MTNAHHRLHRRAPSASSRSESELEVRARVKGATAARATRALRASAIDDSADAERTNAKKNAY